SVRVKIVIRSGGKQLRPGGLDGQGTRIERYVRLVATCYVGPLARVRSCSLITRGSSIEHHSVVDCGTVVEASTLLPLSYPGSGLDLVHSVVGLKRMSSVKYSAELETEDRSLVSVIPASSLWRTVHDAS